MHLQLALVPTEVQHIAGEVTSLTQAVKAALQSSTAIEVEALVDKFVPSAAGLRVELIGLCTAAIGTCEKIQGEDWSGVTARLQRLVADSTQLLHGKGHSLSTYIQWVEAVINDIISK